MIKNGNKLSIEELTKNELSAIENSDKLSRLQKESVHDKKLIEEFKEREKSSARALVLYERKISYIRKVCCNELLLICKKVEEYKQNFTNKSDEVLSEFEDLLEKLEILNSKLQSVSVISQSDRDFILNKKPKESVSANESIEDRFNRLKQEYSQKIGSSVNRGRGRPKKGEQSIVADIGLRKNPKNKVDESIDTQNKLNDIFYNSPTQNNTQSVVSAIPQTEDSLFDFNEALNPNISLKDIMADIMREEPAEEEIISTNIQSANDVKTNSYSRNLEKLKLIEQGYIQTPNIKTSNSKTQVDTIEKNKKENYEKRFLSINNIIKDNK